MMAPVILRMPHRRGNKLHYGHGHYKCSCKRPNRDDDIHKPWNGTTNQLYLYDNNACIDPNPTWDADACRTGSTITPAANAAIDHPNATSAAYDSINPIRSYRNTTYYAVWSVAYMP